MRPYIFISYRRTDSHAQAKPIYEALKTHFGEKNVFFDTAVEALDTEIDKKISKGLKKSQILLVIIGPKWLITMKERRELKDSKDYVFLEIRQGLARRKWKQIRIMPILVDNAPMPNVTALKKLSEEDSKKGSDKNLEKPPAFFQRLIKLIIRSNQVSDEDLEKALDKLSVIETIIIPHDSDFDKELEKLVLKTHSLYPPWRAYLYKAAQIALIILGILVIFYGLWMVKTRPVWYWFGLVPPSCNLPTTIPNNALPETVNTELSIEEPVGGGLGLIAFDIGEANSSRNSYYANIDGTNLKDIFNASIGTYTGDFSPDVSQFIASSRRPNDYPIPEPMHLYIINIDGSNPVNISERHGFQEAQTPAWSPDGRFIAFQGYDWGLHIFVLSLETGELQPITKEGDNYDPAWSPDGQSLVYYSLPKNQSINCRYIYTVNLETLEPIRLTENGDSRAPSWSPDGEHILYETNYEGNWNIYMMDADGGNKHPMTIHPSDDLKPVFSPDGQYFAFVSNRDGEYAIYIMNLDRVIVREVYRGVSPITNLAWR